MDLFQEYVSGTLAEYDTTVFKVPDSVFLFIQTTLQTVGHMQNGEKYWSTAPMSYCYLMVNPNKPPPRSMQTNSHPLSGPLVKGVAFSVYPNLRINHRILVQHTEITRRILDILTRHRGIFHHRSLRN